MVKNVFFFVCILLQTNSFAQKKVNPTNLIIITTDGFRWQEMYNGIDTSIANNPTFNEEDSIGIYKKYANQPIMPFITNYIGKNGQLWGNRNEGNNLSVSNPYWFSYPGYSELLCGFVDDSINSNGYTNNPHTNILDFLQKQKDYKNHIAAFGAWFAFDRILHKPSAAFPIICAFDKYVNKKSTITTTINKLNKEAFKPWDDEECLDVFTHNMALDYLKTQQPKVLYISYGETDEWAHSSKYKSYLNAARQVDDYIKEIWDYVQSNPFYKNNTVILVTVDHGRGIGGEWTSHNNKINRSNETWFAILGKGVRPVGLIKTQNDYYQKQLAQTCANLLGFDFKCEHTVAEALPINQVK
jgi:Sulfatase